MAKSAKAKHLQARVDFLDQAAKLLAVQQYTTPGDVPPASEEIVAATSHPAQAANTGLPLLLTSHLRTVAKRGQIRVSQDTKRSICKICCTPLLDDKTRITRIENASKGSSKAHADVQIIECLNCGGIKRLPVGAKRQTKRSQRPARALKEQKDGKTT